MLKFRLGLILAAVLLCGCDHNKKPGQAGSAAVGQSDSALTGQLPSSADSTNAPTYPRATPVALPVADASTATNASDTASTTTTTTTPSAPDAPPQNPVVATTTSPSDTAATLPSTPPASLPTDSPPPVPPPMSDPPSLTSDSAPNQDQVVVLQTPLGRIVIQLDDFAAPLTCENFRKLVSQGYYDHTTFHRVIPNFVVQGGDPNSKSDDRSTHGQGGPDYKLPPEIKLKHDRGAVAMARLPDSVNPQRESNGSQFYICLVPCPSLDDQYTVFGHVIKGLQVANDIASQPRDKRNNPLTRIEMQARLESKEQALEETSLSNP